MKTLAHWRQATLALCLSFLCGVAFAGPINVNEASAEEIAEALDGVGISKARAIVAHRNANGPFMSQESLAEVKGIGERTIALNAANILLETADKG